jgi:hypothetical protein
MRAKLRVVGAAPDDHAGRPDGSALAPSPDVPRLLWGWPEVRRATGIPRRTLHRLLAVGEFVEPVRRVGKKPYWRPDDVRR